MATIHPENIIERRLKEVAVLPLAVQLDDNVHQTHVYESTDGENHCEYQEEKCTENSGLYFGTEDLREPTFCALHYFTTDGDGKSNYKLIIIGENQ